MSPHPRPLFTVRPLRALEHTVGSTSWKSSALPFEHHFRSLVARGLRELRRFDTTIYLLCIYYYYCCYYYYYYYYYYLSFYLYFYFHFYFYSF